MRRTVTALSTLAAVAVLASGCAGSEGNTTVTTGKAPWETAGAEAAGGHGASGSTAGAAAALASGEIVDPSGKKIGTAAVTKGDHGLTVQVTATGMAPGFHGLHMHAVGKCEPNSADPANAATTGNFLSAGGHLAGGGADHPSHAGDLPVLYVQGDGSGSLSAATDRFTEAQLGQQGGISLIIHAGPDNYANIPTRYAAGGADAETKKAGDAGARIGCAVLAKSGGSATGAGSGSATSAAH